MTPSSKPSLAQAERILAFWHKVEFFESAELKGIEHGEGAIHYRSEELTRSPDGLPWLDRQQIRRAGSAFRPENAYRFKIYLGLFPRGDIFRIAREAYPEKTDAWVERSRDTGLTCSMTMEVDQDGIVDRDSFEISTAPWVLGALQQERLDSVTIQAFEDATDRLRERLTTILTVADNLKREHELPLRLTTLELVEMLKAMEDWTAFAPAGDAPTLVVQLFPCKSGVDAESERGAGSEALEWSAMDSLAPRLASLDWQTAEAQTAYGEAGDTTPAINEIAILNSFFIRDLEKIAERIRTKGLAEGSPLARYLQGDCDSHPDLLKPEGRPLLMRNLALERMPSGRWPADDAHAMSLMQQFAINTIDEELAETGLYSVNGPPGTGKTTMLRDLVARNVVKRAGVLASLASPEAAFGEPLRVNIDDQPRPIRTLIPELTGFEMVVVSSNNAAVENVTRELPQSQALGAAYRDLAFLKPVGQKLAATHERKEGKALCVESLSAKTDCWGLIAAALGKKGNRDQFGERVFFTPIDKCSTEGESYGYSTLIPALKARAEGRDTARDFRVAQRAFREAEQQVRDVQADLARLQALRRQEAETEDARRRCAFHEGFAARVSLWLSERQAKRVPMWPLGAYCTHRAVIKQIRRRAHRATKQAELSQQRLASAARQLEAERGECAPLAETYRDALLQDEGLNLETPEVQRTSFGHCDALNRARAQLTARAFELHEAWLVAVYADKKNTFWTTLNSLMAALNGEVEDRDAAKALWQMLFMIVPVVSSTFASVSNQFRALHEGEIGWVFVDEAGQATPQQAVGALWRARRAVVVGDPLQIEPVFTVPAGLVEAMAKGEFDCDWYKWSPTVSSVQVVADRANPYGTHEIADEFWVGSPLRVHRRCGEPMFSIANRIAYNDKMLHGNEDLPAGPGDSRWFDIGGATENKHFVPDQAAYVATILQRHIDKSGETPNVYIISPFKAVARGMRRHLSETLAPDVFGGRKALRAWLHDRVGTVHTFQGKEEENVIFVLGLSEDAPGAAGWASSKPNLLNVALTRAKKRVYVVGSVGIWGSKKYFSEAKNELPNAQSR